MRDSPIERLLRSAPQFLPGPAEPHITYPQLRISLADLAPLHGALERSPHGVRGPEPELVPDGEDAAGEGVVCFGQGGLPQEGADGVVDAEAGFGPGEEGEEDGVAGEDGDEVVEAGADVDWPEGSALGVLAEI